MLFHVFRWQPRRGPTTYAHRAVMIYLDYTSFNRNRISPRLILFRSIHNEYQDHQFHWTMDHGSVLVNKQRALAGKYTRIKLMNWWWFMQFFLRRKQVGIWYNSWFTSSGKVSKKKTYRISWAPPALCTKLSPYHPFPFHHKEPNPPKLRYLGASKADDKCFFPSSLHGCSAWWPETQLVGWSPKIDPKTQGFVWKGLSKISAPTKRFGLFFGGFSGGQNFKSFWRIQSGKWRWFRGGWRSDAHLGCKVWTSGCVFFCFVLAATTQPTKKNQKET